MATNKNLLRNPSFEDGTREKEAPFISGAWPVAWVLDWYYRETDPILGTGSIWNAPEMIVIEFIKQFPEIEHLFDRAGKFIFKCFWNAATGFGWRQGLELAPGKYVLLVPVKPDQWHDIGNNRQVRPSPATSVDWYLASEVYASCQSADQEKQNTTGWLDARTVPIGSYTVLRVEHNHTGGILTVRFGARGRWPFRNNGWMFDGLSLELISETTPVPVPTPTPVPVPVPSPVQPADIAAIHGALTQARLDFHRSQAALDSVKADLDNADDMVANILRRIS